MASPMERATAARVLSEADHKPEDIADLLHVSLSQVYRYLKDFTPEPEPEDSALADLEELLAGMELNAQQKMAAGIARRLATRLDKVAVSTKAQDALAMPQIAKELRSIVTDILGVTQDDQQWLADVFAPVGHAEDAGT